VLPFDEIDELFGGDPWPYGLEPNRVALQALLDFLVQQSFLPAAPPLEELLARVVTSKECVRVPAPRAEDLRAVYPP
jgi:hypothetical protein